MENNKQEFKCIYCQKSQSDDLMSEVPDICYDCRNHEKCNPCDNTKLVFDDKYLCSKLSISH